MEEKIFFVWYGFFAMCAIIALICYDPALAGPFFGLLAFVVCSGVVLVGVAHALQEGPAPWPDDEWRGEPVEVAEVYPSDFASREEYEEFRRTSMYITGKEDVRPDAIEIYEQKVKKARPLKPGKASKLEIN